jgi:uncharacterized 2Fe-2S/4Fe-4S cluster protein (DUF4445 family)
MPDIFFLPHQKTARVAPGTSISEAAREIGVLIETPCNCAQICGKCRVKLAAADLPHVRQTDTRLTDATERAAGVVLACATAVYGDISVTITETGGARA